MSSNNPCAVYNFYNCCDPSNASGSAPFIWQSGDVLDPMAQPSGTQEVLEPYLYTQNEPAGKLKCYQGLMPLHRKARLIEISLITFPPWQTGAPYTASVMLNLVVLDFNGAIIRTISTATMNYQTIPVRTWTPISLSTVPGDLDIPAGQLVAGEMIFGALLTTTSFSHHYERYQLSGTGMLL
jgi:hypothetical protein